VEASFEAVLPTLWSVLNQRKANQPEGSYTVRLLGDENLRLKKLGEETAELVMALAKEDRGRIPQEAADVVYHLLVALLGSGVTLEDLLKTLEARGA
jgi:phosphoribosyl-ATP pyrophosphohydrolase/phosphoribosyl-AMP cyclohydrolase